MYDESNNPVIINGYEYYIQNKYGCIDLRRLTGPDANVRFNSLTIPFSDRDEDIASIRLHGNYWIDIGCYHQYSEINVSLCYSSEKTGWQDVVSKDVDITRPDIFLDTIEELYNLYQYSSFEYLWFLRQKSNFKQFLEWRLKWRLKAFLRFISFGYLGNSFSRIRYTKNRKRSKKQFGPII